jgi:hypothetical protein
MKIKEIGKMRCEEVTETVSEKKEIELYIKIKEVLLGR